MSSVDTEETAGHVNSTNTKRGNPTIKPRTNNPARTSEDNYPSLRVGASPVRNVRLFDVDLTGYLRLCLMVKDTVWVRMKSHVSNTISDQDWLRIMLYHLAARILCIIKGFESEVVSPTDEVLIPEAVPIPRPLFSYLSSLGDIKLTELNLILRPRFDLDTVRSVIATANDIGGLANATRPVLEIIRIPFFSGIDVNNASQIGRAIVLYHLFGLAAEENQCTDAAFANGLQNAFLPYLAYLQKINALPQQNDGVALAAFVNELIATNPDRHQRIEFQNFQSYQAISGPIQAAIIRSFESKTDHTCFAPRGYARNEAIFLGQRRLAITAAQLATLDEFKRIYRCSTALPTNPGGTTAQIICVFGGNQEDYTLECVVPFPTSVGAMAFACNFNPGLNHPLDTVGYKSLVVHENISGQLAQWIVSNLISKN